MTQRDSDKRSDFTFAPIFNINSFKEGEDSVSNWVFYIGLPTNLCIDQGFKKEKVLIMILMLRLTGTDGLTLYPSSGQRGEPQKKHPDIESWDFLKLQEATLQLAIVHFSS